MTLLLPLLTTALTAWRPLLRCKGLGLHRHGKLLNHLTVLTCTYQVDGGLLLRHLRRLRRQSLLLLPYHLCRKGRGKGEGDGVSGGGGWQVLLCWAGGRVPQGPPSSPPPPLSLRPLNSVNQLTTASASLLPPPPPLPSSLEMAAAAVTPIESVGPMATHKVMKPLQQ